MLNRHRESVKTCYYNTNSLWCRKMVDKKIYLCWHFIL
jgi:hypothetical protein